MTTEDRDAISLHDALAVDVDGDVASATVREGFDVFGIPHGGYMAALGANAVLTWSGQPDLFSVTTHFLRKTDHAPIEFALRELGGSRRFRTVLAEGRQGDRTVIVTMASVGDRTTFEGPSWHDRRAPAYADTDLGPRPEELPEPQVSPAIARRLGLRLERATAHFALGRTADRAVVGSRVEAPPGTPTDQLLALIACDITPPAAWNVLGQSGWVPTVELTAHLRARPAPGPLDVVAMTASVSDGFLEEDAEVYDSTGKLVLLSRQLALWSQPPS